jgi:hypothetical protein
VVTTQKSEEERRRKKKNEERRRLTGFAKEHGGAAVDLDLLSVARRERAVDGPAQGIPFRDRTKAFS